MSEKNPDKKPNKKTFGARRKKRHIPDSMKDPAKSMNDAVNNAINDEKDAKHSASHRRYNDIMTGLYDLAVEKAALQTAISEKGAKLQEMKNTADYKKSTLQVNFELKKRQEIRDFLTSLESTATALQDSIKDLSHMTDQANDPENMKQFVTGLEMSQKQLHKIFNDFSTDKPVERVSEPQDIPPPQTYTAETFEPVDLNDKNIDTEIETTKAQEKYDALMAEVTKLREKESALDTHLENAATEMQAEVTRTGKDIEKKSDTILKKPALAALEIRDQMHLARTALEGQKDRLTKTFNTVASHMDAIQATLDHTLSAFKIDKVESLGEKPDFDIHQAIGFEPAKGIAKGHISKIEQDGFTLKGKPLRDAIVKLAP